MGTEERFGDEDTHVDLDKGGHGDEDGRDACGDGSVGDDSCGDGKDSDGGEGGGRGVPC